MVWATQPRFLRPSHAARVLPYNRPITRLIPRTPSELLEKKIRRNKRPRCRTYSPRAIHSPMRRTRSHHGITAWPRATASAYPSLHCTEVTSVANASTGGQLLSESLSAPLSSSPSSSVSCAVVAAAPKSHAAASSAVLAAVPPGVPNTSA